MSKKKGKKMQTTTFQSRKQKLRWDKAKYGAKPWGERTFENHRPTRAITPKTVYSRPKHKNKVFEDE